MSDLLKNSGPKGNWTASLQKIKTGTAILQLDTNSLPALFCLWMFSQKFRYNSNINNFI